MIWSKWVWTAKFSPLLLQVHHLFSTMKSDQLRPSWGSDSTILQVVGLTPCQSPYYPFITGANDQQRRGLSTGVLLLKLKSMRESGASKKSIIQRRWIQCRAVKHKNGGISWEISSKEWLGACWTRLVACYISSFHPFKFKFSNIWITNYIRWCKERIKNLFFLLFRFSLLSWDQGHLVKVLPCHFNVFRCRWPPISTSPLFRNFPCSGKPAILHFCGNQGAEIIRPKSMPLQDNLFGWLSRLRM